MKHWQLPYTCHEIDNVFGNILACFVHVLLKFQIFHESIGVLLDSPSNDSASFAMETKKKIQS